MPALPLIDDAATKHVAWSRLSDSGYASLKKERLWMSAHQDMAGTAPSTQEWLREEGVDPVALLRECPFNGRGTCSWCDGPHGGRVRAVYHGPVVANANKILPAMVYACDCPYTKVAALQVRMMQPIVHSEGDVYEEVVEIGQLFEMVKVQYERSAVVLHEALARAHRPGATVELLPLFPVHPDVHWAGQQPYVKRSLLNVLAGLLGPEGAREAVPNSSTMSAERRAAVRADILRAISSRQLTRNAALAEGAPGLAARVAAGEVYCALAFDVLVDALAMFSGQTRWHAGVTLMVKDEPTLIPVLVDRTEMRDMAAPWVWAGEQPAFGTIMETVMAFPDGVEKAKPRAVLAMKHPEVQMLLAMLIGPLETALSYFSQYRQCRVNERVMSRWPACFDTYVVEGEDITVPKPDFFPDVDWEMPVMTATWADAETIGDMWTYLRDEGFTDVLEYDGKLWDMRFILPDMQGCIDVLRLLCLGGPEWPQSVRDAFNAMVKELRIDDRTGARLLLPVRMASGRRFTTPFNVLKWLIKYIDFLRLPIRMLFEMLDRLVALGRRAPLSRSARAVIQHLSRWSQLLREPRWLDILPRGIFAFVAGDDFTCCLAPRNLQFGVWRALLEVHPHDLPIDVLHAAIVEIFEALFTSFCETYATPVTCETVSMDKFVFLSGMIVPKIDARGVPRPVLGPQPFRRLVRLFINADLPLGVTGLWADAVFEAKLDSLRRLCWYVPIVGPFVVKVWQGFKLQRNPVTAAKAADFLRCEFNVREGQREFTVSGAYLTDQVFAVLRDHGDHPVLRNFSRSVGGLLARKQSERAGLPSGGWERKAKEKVARFVATAVRDRILFDPTVKWSEFAGNDPALFQFFEWDISPSGAWAGALGLTELVCDVYARDVARDRAVARQARAWAALPVPRRNEEIGQPCDEAYEAVARFMSTPSNPIDVTRVHELEDELLAINVQQPFSFPPWVVEFAELESEHGNADMADSEFTFSGDLAATG
jgi:hypothetical protein